MIRFSCPACGKAILVKDHHAGKTGECSGCHTKLTIPQASEDTAYKLAAVPAQKFAENVVTAQERMLVADRPAEDDSAEDGLPPAPPILPALRKKARSDEPVENSTSRRVRWWLLLYAKVNFILSALISAPLFLVGLVAIVFSLIGMFASFGASQSAAEGAGAAAAAGAMVSGMAIVWALIELAGSLVVFMFLNVFTLACVWGAEVLKLLEPE